jgi:hypothetical protein
MADETAKVSPVMIEHTRRWLDGRIRNVVGHTMQPAIMIVKVF